jgi:nitrogen fixation NifU-like protein
LASPLGSLPPMKVHCAQLVEGALKNALSGKESPQPEIAPTLLDQLSSPKNVKIKLLP